MAAAISPGDLNGLKSAGTLCSTSQKVLLIKVFLCCVVLKCLSKASFLCLQAEPAHPDLGSAWTFGHNTAEGPWPKFSGLTVIYLVGVVKSELKLSCIFLNRWCKAGERKKKSKKKPQMDNKLSRNIANTVLFWILDSGLELFVPDKEWRPSLSISFKGLFSL